MYENSESCLYLMFKNVPKDKLPQIKPKLLNLLKNILQNEDIDMKRMKSIINRRKLECLSNVENDPHHTIAFLIIGHMLYGTTKDDVCLKLVERALFLFYFYSCSNGLILLLI